MGIFDFFKRKKKVQEEQDDRTWTLAEGEENGMPMIYRMRDEVPEGLNTNDYSCLISILWEYEPDNENGIPPIDIYEQQQAFDDALEEIENANIGVMMLALTGNGRREWLWYTNDQNKWLESMQSCLKSHPAYPLDIEASQDPQWQIWKSCRYPESV